MTVRILGMKGIPPSKLRPNPDNPRRDLGPLDELAVSLRTQGVLQPLLVVLIPGTDEFMVYDGHRRRGAALIADLPVVPCMIVEHVPKAAQIMTMLAAAMHEQLDPVEQCEAFHELLEAGFKVKDIAAQTGYSMATIKARLRLSALPPEARQMVQTKEMSLGQADNLAKQVVRNKRGSTTTGKKNPHRFNRSHPVAERAAELCTHEDERVFLGAVACGPCWEQAIREDERAGYDVDTQAVHAAISGDRSINLNPRERHEAILTLLDRPDLTASEIGKHLGVTARTVERAKAIHRATRAS